MKTTTLKLIAIITVLSAVPAWSQTPKGLTWKLLGTNSTTGTVTVGCWSGCNAYSGDTSCTTSLPILCIKKSGTGFPLPVPASVNNSDIYNQWSGGVVGTTQPTVPPATLAAANALCANEFGPDWRVAEFHDGWGWHFQAFGGVGNPSQNFWVDINDQPGATCWN
ncbi:MAG TPA: flagellar hook-length control protein [Thermoanaerobaculia bacterium]|nr:flagellar hook-length control protein [Thermoanaerobaculia bacterium]